MKLPQSVASAGLLIAVLAASAGLLPAKDLPKSSATAKSKRAPSVASRPSGTSSARRATARPMVQPAGYADDSPPTVDGQPDANSGGSLNGNGAGADLTRAMELSKDDGFPAVSTIYDGSTEPAVPDAAEMTLEELVAMAEANSPSLQAASAFIGVTEGATLQAGLYPNPRLDLFTPQLAGSDSQYSAQLTQEFVTKGKLKLNRAAASREVQQADLALVRARFDLLTNVRQGFYSQLAGQRRVEVLNELVAILRRSRDAANRLYKAGEGSKTDVLLLDIELQNAEAGLQNAEALLRAGRVQLAARMGLRNYPIGVVKGDLLAKTPVYAIESHINSIGQNSLVQSAAVDIERTQIRLRREQVEPYPNLTFGAGMQYQVSQPHKQGLITVSIPIPVWNRNQGNIASAQANVARSTANLSVMENNLTQILAEMIGRYQAAQQLVDRYEQRIIPEAQEARTIIQTGFDKGEFDFLRLLQAQRSLMESMIGYIKAQEARWTAAAEIANVLQLEQFP